MLKDYHLCFKIYTFSFYSCDLKKILNQIVVFDFVFDVDTEYLTKYNYVVKYVRSIIESGYNAETNDHKKLKII